MNLQQKHAYEFGTFRLIPSERQLLRDGQIVSLKPKSFDLLVVLVENRGRLIEKEELMKQIWPDSFVEEANLSVNISALRRALGEGPEENHYVETVPRHGYRFVAEVKEHRENGAEIDATPGESNASAHIDATERSIEIPTAVSHRSRFRRSWLFLAAGLLLIAGLIVGQTKTTVGTLPDYFMIS